MIEESEQNENENFQKYIKAQNMVNDILKNNQSFRTKDMFDLIKQLLGDIENENKEKE